MDGRAAANVHTVLTDADGSAYRSLRQRPVTRAERYALGKSLRKRVPRKSLADWTAPPDRPDPVQLINFSHQGRVDRLIPIRVGRMVDSPYGFLRGTAVVMAEDVAHLPATGITPVVCGDSHFGNFGFYASPERDLVIDLNDFDEAHPGCWEWDLRRLAASIWVAGRHNGTSEDHCGNAVRSCVASYRQELRRLADLPLFTRSFVRLDVDRLAAETAGPLSEQVARSAKRARHRTGDRALPRFTHEVDGERKIVEEPPLITRLPPRESEQLAEALDEYLETLPSYRRRVLGGYTLVDVAHKVVGVGSVGLLAFVLLLRGRDENDLMVLQVKQAQASVLEAYTRKSVFTKHGHRVVTGQRLMQAASDSFLGWIDGPAGRSFYVRQLRDMKWSPDPASLSEKRIGAYAMLCGTTLGRAHARSGDAIAISAYLGTGKSFDKAVGVFAESYADQTEQDFAAFTGAIADGRLGAHEDASGAEGIRAVQALNKGPAKPKRTAKRTT
jgi:uncharacterized protein (DUF2252 family)